MFHFEKIGLIHCKIHSYTLPKKYGQQYKNFVFITALLNLKGFSREKREIINDSKNIHLCLFNIFVEYETFVFFL